MALTKYADLELADKPDCTGLMENGRCSRMRIRYCMGENCPLRRTKAEEVDTYQRLVRRLCSLDEQTQAKIARKYYGGKQYWHGKEAGELLTKKGT